MQPTSLRTLLIAFALFAAGYFTQSLFTPSVAQPAPAPASPASAGSASTATKTLYERLGGHDAIVAVVEDAFANAGADPRINQRFHLELLPALKKHFIDLVCLRTGGPCTYTGANMAAAHEGMFIRDDEFDALMEDIGRSLDKFKVPARERGELMAVIVQMKNAVTGH